MSRKKNPSSLEIVGETAKVLCSGGMEVMKDTAHLFGAIGGYLLSPYFLPTFAREEYLEGEIGDPGGDIVKACGMAGILGVNSFFIASNFDQLSKYWYAPVVTNIVSLAYEASQKAKINLESKNEYSPLGAIQDSLDKFK